MFVDEVKTSSEHQLASMLHTLKHVHNIELQLDESAIDEIEFLRDTSEIIKNSIVSESAFNTWHSNPSYAKHMLIVEAVRLYLTEIAPRRRPKHLREGIESRLDESKSTAVGRWMMDFAENARTKDDKMLAVLNSFGRVGEDLVNIGQPFGPKTINELVHGYQARVNDDQGEEYDRRQAKENLMALRLGYQMYDKHHAKNPVAATVDETDGVVEKEEMTDEGNQFSGALAAARAAGKDEFDVDGTTYKVSENMNSVIAKALTEDHMQKHDYQASMARAELYRNAKYGMDMLRMIRPDEDVEPWIAACLTKAAGSLDKIYHYLDYYTKFEPTELGMKPSAPAPSDDEELEEDLGETSGSTARQNLMLIVEYSIKLFHMIQPGDHLEGWVAMKLTQASEGISSSKHYLDYKQFERHASDAVELDESMKLDEDMTRKDFKMVADLIKAHPDAETRHKMAKHHAEIFAKRNPRFHRGKFFSAANASQEPPKKHHKDDVNEAYNIKSINDVLRVLDNLRQLALPIAMNEKSALSPSQFASRVYQALQEVDEWLRHGKVNETRRIIGEQTEDLAQAETLIAAKSLSDELQTMAEKVAKMGVDDLMPLVDTMKTQFGPEAADAYNNVMKTNLETLLHATQEAKDNSDNAVMALQGGQLPATSSDIEQVGAMAGDEAGDATVGDELPAPEGDGLSTTPADAGGEEPLGRAKKPVPGEEVSEAWDAEMKTAEKDKGKWDGWSIAELKAKKKKLMDKPSRDADEQKTVKQIDFAIRAKQKDKWGAIKEESTHTKDERAEKAGKKVAKDIEYDERKKDGIHGAKRGKEDDKAERAGRKVAKDIEHDEKMHEAKKAKPDFLDVDKDGDTKEPMKKALKDKSEKGVKEAKKAKSPYAIGMYQAKKEAGMDPDKPAKDLPKKMIKRAHEIARSIDKTDESIAKLTSMLEAAQSNLAGLEKKLAKHRADWSRMVNEGVESDLLNHGQGFEGDLIQRRIAEANEIIEKLSNNIASIEANSNLQLAEAVEAEHKAYRFAQAKEKAGWGVMVEGKDGKRDYKFFEDQRARDYWVQLNADTAVSLINPEHFDIATKK